MPGDAPRPDLDFETSEQASTIFAALRLLQGMGWQALTPEEALRMRRGRLGSVLLEPVLAERLAAVNRVRARTSDVPFSEANIATAIERLRGNGPLGLLRANEAMTDLLLLGTSLPQMIEGETRSHSLRYIDWTNPGNNVFHVVPEFEVTRSRRTDSYIPDLVLFVNGIPLGVIEGKAMHVDVKQGISQHLRNQSPDGITALFATVQILGAINIRDARYATVGTPAKFWAIWRDDPDEEAAVRAAVGSEPSTQDRLLHALFRPDRILDMARRFTLFDAGEKKVARYQQVHAIKRILTRLRSVGPKGTRPGGVLWHTQGSGKSLTMVMLARALAVEEGIPAARVVLVTDRTDLDDQLSTTFRNSGLEPVQATSGRHLVESVLRGRGLVSSTLQKFNAALNLRDLRDDSPDVFLLVDESHRSQSGAMHTRLRRVFPNACYLGFTGTPLLKKEKSTFARFGDLIDRYDMRQAVEDGQVVPLLYEGRLVEQEVNKAGLDVWFERTTTSLSPEAKADLKRRFARMAEVGQTSGTLAAIAFDISQHFASTFGGTPFKGQIVAFNKRTAVRLKKALDDIGLVTSEVVISPPDERENHEEVEEEPSDEVQAFWRRMVGPTGRYGDERAYVEGITTAFKKSETPELLICVSKLLTGFDAPRNAVLYICRKMEKHELLQAIARVNRLFEGKEHGLIVDYQGLLGSLDKALAAYDALAGYDEEDIADIVHSVKEEVNALPQRHADLLDVFRGVPPPADLEACRRHLADDDRRRDFYVKLAAFGRTLHTALSVAEFVNDPANSGAIARYKADLKRFHDLRTAAKASYEPGEDTSALEPRIRKLLDQHVTAHEVRVLTPAVDILDKAALAASVEAAGGTPAAKADVIASALKRTLTENMDEDPALYRRFADMIEQVILDFRQGRLDQLDYLQKVEGIQRDFTGKRDDALPEGLRSAPDAAAFFREAAAVLAEAGVPEVQARDVAANFAVAAEQVVARHRKVDWTEDADAQRAMQNDLDDYLFDHVRGELELSLPTAVMDDLIVRVLRVARARMAGSGA
jgi:type I restriction enzyme R subunit